MAIQTVGETDSRIQELDFMVMKELVTQINSELKALLNDATQHGESPRLVRVIQILERLTNLNPETIPAPACEHKEIVDGQCTDCGGEIPSLQTGATAEAPAPAPQKKCPPHLNINPYGVCRDCNTCLHEFRNYLGICNQCGDEKPPRAAEPEQPAA